MKAVEAAGFTFSVRAFKVQAFLACDGAQRPVFHATQRESAPLGRIFEISTLTGAPAALAFALGFQDVTNGVATPTAPIAPSAAVAPTKNYGAKCPLTAPLRYITPVITIL